jgi:hypothetical protein
MLVTNKQFIYPSKITKLLEISKYFFKKSYRQFVAKLNKYDTFLCTIFCQKLFKTSFKDSTFVFNQIMLRYMFINIPNLN